MSYIGSWDIDDLLTFVINTQVFSTGVATDADSAPAYRVYEDETGTPLLTGTMALLDSANTAGFYSEQITLSAANGFEKGKCYSIYISATVSSVAGATHRTFQIAAAVDAQYWNALATVELPLVPTTAGRKLDVSAGGEAGIDWANVGSPTTAVDLSGTNIKTDQKVDINTIKTNPVVNAGTVTFPTTATLASTTNITAGTVTTATNVTTVNGLAAGVITAASIAANAINDSKVDSDVTIASVTGAVGSVTGAVGSVTGAVGSVAAGGITAASFAANAITAAKLDPDVTTELQAGLATQASVDDLPTNAELATALAAADDAVLAQVALVKAKTDSLTFTVAGQVDSNIQSVNDTTVNGNGQTGTEWGP